jgi:DNA-directed RNA polymerase alpha subunit
MKTEKSNSAGMPLPYGLAQPAQRALASAGIESLEQLSRFSEAEIRKLHGVGPNALEKLRQVLNARGMSFAEDNLHEKDKP